MVGFRFATLFLFFIFDLGSKAGVVYVFLSMRFLGKWQAGQGVLYGNSWAGCDNRIGYHFCSFLSLGTAGLLSEMVVFYR